jgi:hypothetical protein
VRQREFGAMAAALAAATRTCFIVDVGKHNGALLVCAGPHCADAVPPRLQAPIAAGGGTIQHHRRQPAPASAGRASDDC